MPRGPREVEVDWPYHVVIRGNNRRRIFSYKSDYEKFLWLLRDASRKVECPIHSVGMLSNPRICSSAPRPKMRWRC